MSYIYTIGCYAERLAYRLKHCVFANILKRETAFFDLNRSGELFLEEGEWPGGGRVIPPYELHGNITMNHVAFSYPSRNEAVFENLSLNIPAGSVVALVGESGGGKSTIVSLIERLYDVDSGSVTLDGCDIKDLDLKWLRGQVIGYEPCLFATSIFENIRFGNPSATDLQVVQAAQMADAHEFITAFPNGYSTMVGEEGHFLSGGQKQRIAIARALIKNPSVLIFDEATSALDSEAEKAIFKSIENISAGL
ncbi:mitochondrial potassium channel ATP-binding subunit-like [Octopus sinensis]|uniref:Mitochondrial potassium channel ATP-binding subunit-like n=1 Tax=Octopus sinensis TaxID=2607531 RepID=A0A6P7TTS0_9MOLL|nr:mitochondrial potassium channel ATP-binding subunit-like [Octopus sinensis]